MQASETASRAALAAMWLSVWLAGCLSVTSMQCVKTAKDAAIVAM